MMGRVAGSALTLVAVVLVLGVGGCGDETVTAASAASVSVSPEQATLSVGGELQLSATVRDASGNILPGRQIQWFSTASAVAAVDANGLVEGRSPGSALIEASVDGVTGSAQVQVEPASRIALEPDEVRLQAEAGQPATEPRTVEVTNAGGGSLTELTTSVTYPANEPGGWLSLSLSSTQAPASLEVIASAQGLELGSYTAHVEVWAPTAENSPATVSVRFEVGEGPTSIVVSSTALGFSSEEGEGPPPAQTVTVTNGGGGELSGLTFPVSYPDGEPSGWLSVQAGGTTAPVDLTIRANPDGLSSGTYDAFVDVTSPVAVNSPVRIQVRLTLGSPPPRIELVPESVSFQVEEAQAPPAPAQVEVRNTGTGTLAGLQESIAFPSGVLGARATVSLEGTSAPTTLVVSVVETDLLPGQYEATVSVSSDDALNSPQTLGVSMEVLPRPSAEESRITADPEEIEAGGQETSQITVTLRDPRGDPLGFGGADVELSTTAGELSPVTDQGDGTYTATLTSPPLPLPAASATVTGSVNGEAIQDTAVVVFTGSISLSESTVEADPEELPADGTSTSQITVTPLDGNGDPIPDESLDVTLELEGEGTLSPVNFDSESSTYQATLTAPDTPGSATIRARVDGELLEDSATVDFVASETAQIAIVSGDDQVGAAGERLADSLVVRVTDGLDNPLPGVDVTWTPSGDGSVNPGTSTTDADGLAATAWNLGSEPGTQFVDAAADGVTESVTFSATAEDPDAAATSLAFISEAQTITAGETSNPIAVELQDAQGNTATSDGGTQVQLSSDSEGTFRNPSDTADIDSIHISDGESQASFRYTSTQVGTHLITASAEGLESDSQELEVEPEEDDQG
jgi:adhesin/invasin